MANLWNSTNWMDNGIEFKHVKHVRKYEPRSKRIHSNRLNEMAALKSVNGISSMCWREKKRAKNARHQFVYPNVCKLGCRAFFSVDDNVYMHFRPLFFEFIVQRYSFFSYSRFVPFAWTCAPLRHSLTQLTHEHKRIVGFFVLFVDNRTCFTDTMVLRISC